MSVSTTIRVVGVKDTITALRKIDPQLQKDFRARANDIAAPAIAAGKAAYTEVPLTGMMYSWTSSGRNRKNFPFVVSKAQNGVKLRLDTRRATTGAILIEQKDPAAAIFETAGRANINILSASLGFDGWGFGRPGRTRLLGPAVYKVRRSIEKEMQKMILDAAREVRRLL